MFVVTSSIWLNWFNCFLGLIAVDPRLAAGPAGADSLASVVAAALQDELGTRPGGDDRNLLPRLTLRAGRLGNVVCRSQITPPLAVVSVWMFPEHLLPFV